MKDISNVLTKKELSGPARKVRKALYSKSHQEDLRQSVTDVVEGAVDDVCKRVDDSSSIDKQKLVDVGWESFVPTLGRYTEQSRLRLQEDKKPFKFETTLRFHVGTRVAIYLKKHNILDE